MGKKIRLFELAELIFSCDENQLSTLTHEEIFLTQEKFKELLKVFTTDATHYTTNFIKKRRVSSSLWVICFNGPNW